MVAIHKVDDYNTWKPQTETVLDARLGHFSDEIRENAQLIKISSEMGKNLIELYTQTSFISCDGYAGLLKNSPDLKILNLSCAYKTGDTALALISQFQSLEELNLNFARNEAELQPMDQYSQWHNPEAVEHITDLGVEKILTNCKKLTKLDLSGTRITVTTLDLIAKTQNLTTLKVDSCWDLKKGEIETLAKVRPDLKIIIDLSEDATIAYKALAKGVQVRYLQTEEKTGGRQSLQITLNTPAKEKELISVSAFF